MVEKTFNFIVNGGEATGGPPIGPALGPLGVNIMAIVNKINQETAEYKGVPVPVDVTLDTDTKEFTVEVGMLSTFALITQALGIAKGSPTPNTEHVGDLAFDQVVDIARRKRQGLFASTLKGAVKEIVGSCQSMGVTIEGFPAGEVQAQITAGEFDMRLAEAG
ncbi:MAG: 50S ribosomal protein L11 [Candidatus Bathyarchaeota archaeon]|nr:MAG: 50S ribosomal protein L11 [Candidatus Bathyarchaeota archaeon]